MSNSGKRIVVIDDQPVMRIGIVHVITESSRFEVCGQAGTTPAALDLIQTVQPDLVTLDFSSGGGSILEFLKELRQRSLSVQVLVFSGHSEEIFAERILRAGARGFVSKSADFETLLAALSRIVAGEIFVSAQIATRMFGRIVSSQDPACSPIRSLTDRELEVFHLIGRGLGTREISERLNRSIKTVQAHRENVKRKLKISSASELLQYALSWAQDQVGTLVTQRRGEDPHQRQQASPHPDAHYWLLAPGVSSPIPLPPPRSHVIGRGDKADIVIKSPLMSRNHAEFSFREDGIWLADLNSTNGTHLNGYALRAACRLQHQDQLSFGGYNVEFQILSGAEKPIRNWESNSITQSVDYLGLSPAPGGKNQLR